MGSWTQSAPLKGSLHAWAHHGEIHIRASQAHGANGEGHKALMGSWSVNPRSFCIYVSHYTYCHDVAIWNCKCHYVYRGFQRSKDPINVRSLEKLCYTLEGCLCTPVHVIVLTSYVIQFVKLAHVIGYYCDCLPKGWRKSSVFWDETCLSEGRI